MKKVQDHYFKQAKKKGYAARSAFKLEEIDRSHQIIRRSDKVLDLGCFPGSWMQYISSKVGPDGLVLGIDRQSLKLSLKPNMRFLMQDINELDQQILSEYSPFWDVVCSDMAPNTTGIRNVDAARSYNLCEIAYLIAEKYLKTSGNLLVKIFQGEYMNQMVNLMKGSYKSTKIIKPKSSRNESREVFILGLNKLNQSKKTG